jgi:hypothetical protein
MNQTKIIGHPRRPQDSRNSRVSMKAYVLAILLTCCPIAQAQLAAVNPDAASWGSALKSLPATAQVPVDAIEQSEYEIHWQPSRGAYMAPNRAHNFRFTFANDGFTATPRELEEGDLDWRLSLKLSSYGKSESLPAPAISGPTLSGVWATVTNTAQLRGDGITISYRNDTTGLRQEFLVSQKPLGQGPLWLNFKAEHDLLDLEADEIENCLNFLATGFGTNVVRYLDLKVFDANQKSLEAKVLKIDDDRFAIVVDDEGAQYPILTSGSLQAVGNETNPQAGSRFGYSVAFFINITYGGLGSQTGPMAGAAPYGGILVGAPYFDPGSVPQAGKVFYFDCAGSGALKTTPTWTYTGNQSYEHVGFSVADARYVKYASTSDKFHAVLVGAPDYSGAYSHEGAAFVFYADLNGVISNQPSWTVTGGQAYASCGWSVAGVGDVNGDGWDDVLIGAPNYSNSMANNGKAALYYGSSVNGLSLTPAWTAYGRSYYEKFGTSVAGGNIDGQNFKDVIIGAPGLPETNSGSAYVYLSLPGGGLNNAVATILQGEHIGDQFGTSVASVFDQNGDAMDDVLIGAPMATYSALSQAGKVYLYRGSSTGVSTPAVWTAGGLHASDYFGSSVAGGKVDSDSYADMIVGSPGWSSVSLGLSKDGAVALFLTDTNGLPAITPSSLNAGLLSNVRLGTSVAYGGFLVNQQRNIIGGAPYGTSPYQNVQVWIWVP